MANPKLIISPLIVLIINIIIANCESISQPPSSVSAFYVPYPAASPVHHSHVPTTPSLPATPTYPATPSYPAEPIAIPASSPVSSSYGQSPAPSPGYYSPSPATPSYSLPATPTYPATPASPAEPIGRPASSPAPNPAYYSPSPATPSYSLPATPTYPATPASPTEPIYIPAPAPAAPPPYPVYYVSRGIKAAYWPSFNGLVASSIDTSYFTHIYYAFLLLDPSTFKLNITPFDQETIPDFINTLRAKNPPVKTLLSIGGADPNQTNYLSIMSRTNQTRAIFINSTIELARNYGFDGLDLDWESPANDQEMINLALLFQEWREAINFESTTTGKPSLLLSSAVYYSSRFTTYGEPRSYPIQAINNFLDWINPMCYDYHGLWDNFTAPHAALFDPNSNVSTSYGIGSWIKSGVLPEKIVMGLPLYGKTWTLQDPNVNGIGAAAAGVGPGDGILNYNQILDFNNENKGVVHFDNESVSYYSVAGHSWIGYDDTMSVNLKIRFARSRGLGGYFFWALGQDKDWTISKQASRSWDR